MQFIYGALSAVAFLFCISTAYWAGQRSVKTKHREPSDEAKRKAEKIRKGFEQLMSYDVSKALKGDGHGR